MVKNLRKKKKGFTLIELIIVIAIIAVLATIAIPRFGEVRKNAANKADLANAKTIANAAAVLLEEGKDVDDIAGEVTEDSSVGKYLQTIPTLQKGGNFTVAITDEIISVTDGDEIIYPEKVDSSSSSNTDESEEEEN